MADRYVEAYSRYIWPVDSIGDLRLAPFHLLASEGRTHTDHDHTWHLETLAAICRQDEGLLVATPYRVIDVTDEGIEVKAGDRVTGVEIELTNRIATLSGLVTTARGEPAKAYTVVIFPADERRWKTVGRYLRTANPERDGRYRISSVVPADYYIIALDKVEPGAWNDPEFLEYDRYLDVERKALAAALKN